MDKSFVRILATAGLALGVLTLLLPRTADAQINGQVRAAMKACAPDYEKFCSTVERGNGRILQCLVSHKNELSSGCEQGLQSLKALKSGNNGQ